MKALGISVGRPNGNSEVLAKEALMEIKKVTGALRLKSSVFSISISSRVPAVESCMISMLKGEGKTMHPQE